ncbi:unnamed protein product [Dicrocoelium dendriticum]|nr:unnamed protein product [Dicrocoelium dendriticum]
MEKHRTSLIYSCCQALRLDRAPVIKPTVVADAFMQPPTFDCVVDHEYHMRIAFDMYLQSNNVPLLSVDDFCFKSYLRLGDYYECNRTGQSPQQAYVKMSEAALNSLTSAGLRESDDANAGPGSTTWFPGQSFDSINGKYTFSRFILCIPNECEFQAFGRGRQSRVRI